MTDKRASAEYVLLMAMLMSIGALGTDIMLPALEVMGRDLAPGAQPHVHYIVSAFFVGMALGQLLAGPLSDSFGRKPVVYAGYAIFTLGCVISYLTESWAIMLAARALQGLGASGPRVVTVAMVRDEYEGRAMARIMSVIMTAFILVPILAPALGQGLIVLGGWRLVFAGLAVLGLAVSFWFALRQPETLPRAKRPPFRLATIRDGLKEIVTSRVALGYTIASGLINGAFLAYLGSAQKVFEGIFEVGTLFAAYFALASAALGVAALMNAGLVMRYGMRFLTRISLLTLALLSLAFWAILPAFDGLPPLWLFLVWQLSTFFCIGITFGNTNALALEPLGHIAGLAAAFVGAIATALSLPLSALISNRIETTVTPLVVGFVALGLASWAVALWADREARR